MRAPTGAHVDEGVVDQHQFVEVELVGEPLPFSLVEDPLVVVVPVEEKRTGGGMKQRSRTVDAESRGPQVWCERSRFASFSCTLVGF